MRFVTAFGFLLSLAAGPAAAQTDFPTKPITFIVGFAPGGGMDTMARLVAARVSTELGQPVVVENRPGAGGMIAPANVAAAAPDGYTIYAGETAVVLGPVFQKDVGFDPITSFAPIARVAVAPHALVAHPDAKANSVKEFIDLVSQSPGEYFYAAPGTTTLQYLAGEMLQTQAKLQFDAVQFQGGAPSVAAVVSGEVPFGIVSLSAGASQAAAGKLKVLGHTGPSRVEGFEKVEPIGETIAGFEAMPGQYLFAPAATPKDVLDKLTNAVDVALKDEDLRKKLRDSGLIPSYQSGADVAAEMPEITRVWQDVAIAVRDKAKP